jgi:hypothetical protein
MAVSALASMKLLFDRSFSSLMNWSSPASCRAIGGNFSANQSCLYGIKTVASSGNIRRRRAKRLGLLSTARLLLIYAYDQLCGLCQILQISCYELEVFSDGTNI